ncbi:MAG: hypothetical protein AAF849_22080 [Bacteroidota bacterium]
MRTLPILFLIIITLFSCDSEKVVEIDENAFVYRTEEGTLKLTKDPAFYKELFSERFQHLEQEIDFEKFWIHSNGESAYLMGKGTTKVGTTEAAIEIVEQDNAFAFGNCSESCSGVGCSHCKLVIGDGCDCEKKATSDGYCNHSIDCDSYY